MEEQVELNPSVLIGALVARAGGQVTFSKEEVEGYELEYKFITVDENEAGDILMLELVDYRTLAEEAENYDGDE